MCSTSGPSPSSEAPSRLGAARGSGENGWLRPGAMTVMRSGGQADERHEVALRRLGVGDDRGRALHELEREVEDLEGDGRDERRADAAVREREQDDVVAGHDGARRVDAVEQVRLPVVDDVNHVGVEVADEPRVDGEATELDVQLRPGRRARLPLLGDDGGRPQPRHGDALLQQRVAQPLGVQAHAGLPLVAVVVEHRDAERDERREALVERTRRR